MRVFTRRWSESDGCGLERRLRVKTERWQESHLGGIVLLLEFMKNRTSLGPREVVMNLKSNIHTRLQRADTLTISARGIIHASPSGFTSLFLLWDFSRGVTGTLPVVGYFEFRRLWPGAKGSR